MVLMKKIFFFCLLILLTAAASATSINVAEDIPSSVAWSFSVSFGSLDSFDRAEIFIDNEKIVTIYSVGSKLILEENATNKKFVSSVSIAGSSAYLSCLGLIPKDRTIKIKTYDDGGLVEEKTASVEFYDIIDKINSSALKSRLDELSATVNGMRADISSFSGKLKQGDESIAQLNESLSDISSSIESIEQQLESSNADIGSIEQSFAELNLAVESVEAQLRAMQEEAEEAKRSGLAGFINMIDISWLPIALGAIILVAVVAFLAKKTLEKRTSIYSKKDEFGLPKEETKEESKEQPLEEEKEEAEEEKQGKWAFKEK